MKSRQSKKRQKVFEVPAYMQPREPEPLSPLAAFVVSLEGEMEYLEATLEYQENWCSHELKKQMVLAITANPGEEEFEYIIACMECGLERKRKGRPHGQQ